METVFYYPNVREVAVGQPENGGSTVCYVLSARRKPRPLPEGADRVLDFEACRRALAGAPEGEPGETEETRRERPARRRIGGREERLLRWLGLALDLCATAAIVVFAAVMTVHLLGGL